MITETVKFNATDSVILEGFLNKCENKNDKILIQIHGMTSSCFKNRNKTIAFKAGNLGVDTLCFNNRGSDIVKYCKKESGEKILQGTAYEIVEDSYYDIVGAIEYVVNLGYKEIYLQGHSLGSTKIVYTYNKLLEENNQHLQYIKAIILLSLVDVPDVLHDFTTKEFIELANIKEQENKLEELMPIGSSIHPLSVKTYLKYIKYYENINFAQYSNDNYNYKELNNINIPLFMRWGNNKELIKQEASALINTLKQKLDIEKLDINYIDGANHSYDGYEDIVSADICNFLKQII